MHSVTAGDCRAVMAGMASDSVDAIVSAEKARRRIEACGFEVDEPEEGRPDVPTPAQGSLF